MGLCIYQHNMKERSQVNVIHLEEGGILFENFVDVEIYARIGVNTRLSVCMFVLRVYTFACTSGGGYNLIYFPNMFFEV